MHETNIEELCRGLMQNIMQKSNVENWCRRLMQIPMHNIMHETKIGD